MILEVRVSGQEPFLTIKEIKKKAIKEKVSKQKPDHFRAVNSTVFFHFITASQ